MERDADVAVRALVATYNACHALVAGGEHALVQRLSHDLTIASDEILSEFHTVVLKHDHAPNISGERRAHLAFGAGLLAYAGPLCRSGPPPKIYTPGAFVGTVNAIEDEIATQRKLGEIAALVAHVVNDEVRLRKAAPQLVLSTRIAVAGEAAVAPLQYAYFLPEDGGASCEGPPMTVVFEDVYAARCATSSPRSTLLDLASRSPPELLSMTDASTWFRGHDLAHFVRPLAEPRVVDVHARIVVSEAFSDAIGYLWMRRTGVTAEAASHFFLTELLRYMSQGLAHGGDAAAALVELSHLVSSGAAEVTSEGSVRWSPDAVDIALQHLARELWGIFINNQDRVFLNKTTSLPASAVVHAVAHRLEKLRDAPFRA